MTPADLAAWIADLRGRLDRGLLASSPHVEARARYAIELVESWRAATDQERASLEARQQRGELAEELGELYALIVEGEAEAQGSAEA